MFSATLDAGKGEEEMSEVKQTNFRINQETADAFRKFCEENGMNQAQGFDHVMQIVEMDKAKALLPERASDIEEFEMHVKAVSEAFLKSVETGANAKALALEQYASALASRDKTIADLQTRLSEAQESQQAAEQAAKEAGKEAAQAVKDAGTAKEQAETAAKLAAEKDRTIATLADKLAVAEEKANGYDSLKEEAQKTEAALAAAEKDHETALRELRAETERKISDAKKDAELEKEKAVAEKEREMTAQLREADRESARLQAKIELLEERLKSLMAEKS